MDNNIKKIIKNLEVYCPNKFECCASIEILTKPMRHTNLYYECINDIVKCDTKIHVMSDIYCLCPVRYKIAELYESNSNFPK